MPKFNLDINLTDAEIAEAREDWKGPLPPKGSYPAKMKVVQFKEIVNGKNKGSYRISIVATLDTGDKYDGCPVYGGVNLTEQGAQYVNQWLYSLTDGSDAAFKKLQTAFQAGPIVDEKKENVLKIGSLKINSPEGEQKILISLKQDTYNGDTSCKIVSFLPKNGAASSSSVSDDDDAIEEDDVEDDESDSTEDEAGDESLFEDEDEEEAADE
jgi:hypothetical protein